ncbi:MAG TPA: hypothetical protein VKS60_24970 [Stellaceae bacterium]|nr:hypothetical protein [Stellaceae bacterium]
MFRAVLAICLLVSGLADATPLKTRTVVLIVSDGLRWQEVFTGAEKDLLTTDHGGNWYGQDYLSATYWRETPEARRQALFPFIWGTIARQGQIIGNQTKGSIARVTNGLAFSYPGYNEMLTGAPDSRIDSNEFGPNPNVTVYEWLNGKPEFHDRVAVFATWDAFADIFNEKRSRIATMVVGTELPYRGDKLTPDQAMVDRFYRETTMLDHGTPYDAFMQVPLIDFARTKDARAIFVGYGETDDWAHAGRYDLVLESAHGFDHHVEELWSVMQSRPEYHGTTTFILTADHGRGSGPEEWKEHGVDQKGSENIWIAAIGPDTPPLGERTNIAPVTQAQIAATVAALLGQDYRAAFPKAAPSIAALLPAAAR